MTENLKSSAKKVLICYDYISNKKRMNRDIFMDIEVKIDEKYDNINKLSTP